MPGVNFGILFSVLIISDVFNTDPSLFPRMHNIQMAIRKPGDNVKQSKKIEMWNFK